MLHLSADATRFRRAIPLLKSQIDGIKMIELYLELYLGQIVDYAMYQTLRVVVSIKFKGFKLRIRYHDAQGDTRAYAATLKPGFGDTLAALIDLQNSNLSGIRLENNSTMALASAFTVLTQIQTLFLSRCNITATGATSLLSALLVLTTLKTLDLSGQGLGDAIWLALSALLPRAVFQSVSSSAK